MGKGEVNIKRLGVTKKGTLTNGEGKVILGAIYGLQQKKA